MMTKDPIRSIITSCTKNIETKTHVLRRLSVRRLISSRRREQPPEEKVRSVNPSRRNCGWIPMGGLSIRAQLHFIPRRRSAGSPHLPLYHLVSPWATRAIDLLEVEGTRRRTLPARSSRYACVPLRSRLSRTVRCVMTELSSPSRLCDRGKDR